MRELGEELSEAELDLMMREADKDGDGRIDFDEFKLMQNFPPATASAAAAADAGKLPPVAPSSTNERL